VSNPKTQRTTNAATSVSAILTPSYAPAPGLFRAVRNTGRTLITMPQADNEAVRALLSGFAGVAAGLLNPAFAVWFGIGAFAALAFGFSESALAVLRRERP
jgi:hypothetical protein